MRGDKFTLGIAGIRHKALHLGNFMFLARPRWWPYLQTAPEKVVGAWL